MGYLDNTHERLRVHIRGYLEEAIHSQMKAQVAIRLRNQLVARAGRLLHSMLVEQLEQQIRLRLQKDLHATLRLYTPASSRRISEVR